MGKEIDTENVQLVLLICLRDPNIQKATSICDLLQLFCKGDTKAVEIATACSGYLFSNGGKDITFLIDDMMNSQRSIKNRA